ncbi:MAG: nuclear transport factor 2 family protein [Cyclobacteriaceae bacterium]|nr:nuclear transport factor 2 family protein [Cyclobacteriaceae bacterium]MCH8516047.1 nuclear transport factor 2 family protein [Cyclobacteriaceae bacterium]
MKISYNSFTSKIIILFILAFIGFQSLVNAQSLDLDEEILSKELNAVEHTADSLASLQLEGYNTGNIELFLSAFSDEVEVYTFPEELQYKGIDLMRKRYAKLFDESPDLFCHLVNRIVFNNFVFDQELVTGFRGRDDVVKALAIYEIEDGKISKVYFMPRN